ncbi:gamma-glutamyltransferase, partial [Streptomyces sp. NPDC059374]
MRRRVARKLSVLAVSAAVVSVGAAAPPGPGGARPVEKVPVAAGYGGSVASVDADPTPARREILGKGGPAVDPARAPPT